MPCPKPTFLNMLVRNTPIVLFIFLLGDFIYYGLITGSPADFGKDILQKILFTLLLAIGYGYLYGRASRIWRDGNPPQGPAGNPPEGPKDGSVTPFIYEKKLRTKQVSCKASWPKIANGIIFSLMISALWFFIVLVGSLMIINIYVFIFHGIRGDFTLSTTDAAIKALELTAAGVLLESHGKTESDGDY